MTNFVTISLEPARQIAHRILVIAPVEAGWAQAGGLLEALKYQRVFGNELFLALSHTESTETVAWMKLLHLLGLNPRQTRVFDAQAGIAAFGGLGASSVVGLVALLQPWLTCLVAPERPGVQERNIRAEISTLAARCGRQLRVVTMPGGAAGSGMSCREFLHRLQDSSWVLDRLAGAENEGDRMAAYVRNYGRDAVPKFCAQVKALLAKDDALERQLLAEGNQRAGALACTNRYLAVTP